MYVRVHLYISLSAMHAPPNSKNAGLQNVLPEECAEIYPPSIYATEKYSVVRGFTPVRRYLPRKMECINEWNEKNSRERAVQGLAGAIF